VRVAFGNLGGVQTYLVTGGAGFIGSHLCDRLLAEGKRVIAVDDLSQGRIANLSEARGYDKQFGLVNMDVRVESLRAEFERERPEVVMHLAAQVSVTASVSDPAHDASVNLMGLLNVLEAAASTGARKVVFAASGGTLYGEVRRFPVKETARRGSHPVSPYGISKKAAEDYLAFYQRTRGLDYTSLALANVYGPRQDPHGEAGVVAIFASKMLAGEPPTIFGDGEQTRDFRVRGLRGGRVRPGGGTGIRGARQHRHRGRDQRERGVQAARPVARVPGPGRPRAIPRRGAPAERPRPLAGRTRARMEAVDTDQGRPESHRRRVPRRPLTPAPEGSGEDTIRHPWATAIRTTRSGR